MTEISVYKLAGVFAENKDLARQAREETLMPALDAGKKVTLNFEGVEAATQSFVHALLSDTIRKHGPDVLDQITFKSCSPAIQKIISIVVDYTQEGL